MVHLVIPNTEAAIGEVSDRFRSDVELHGYDSATSFALVLGLTETLNNAYRHGNRGKPERHIVVRYRLCAGAAEIDVTDDGDGFDPHGIVDPTADENLARPNGRGILLMKSLFDDVEFKQGGRKVRLLRQTKVA